METPAVVDVISHNGGAGVEVHGAVGHLAIAGKIQRAVNGQHRAAVRNHVQHGRALIAQRHIAAISDAAARHVQRAGGTAAAGQVNVAVEVGGRGVSEGRRANTAGGLANPEGVGLHRGIVLHPERGRGAGRRISQIEVTTEHPETRIVLEQHGGEAVAAFADVKPAIGRDNLA